MRNNREFHVNLPRIDKKTSLWVLAVALAGIFALSACAGAERIGANTVLTDCDIVTSRLFEGAILSVEGANPDNSIRRGDVAHIYNPFYLSGTRGKKYYVGYRFGGNEGPRLQFFVPEDMATRVGSCDLETGTTGSYESDNGYLFTTSSGKQLQAGYIRIDRKK
jgi:hypothetical protein